ncbi:MAG: M50 family metallopeptidase [Candidatus Paceibacterota bacterium]|jgi:regulator of sigma E protease
MTVLIVFLIIVAISIILAVHELGHFLIAKLFGIKVEEFGIGFPPKIIGRKFKGTLYTLNAVPFGAMVKIETGTPEDKNSFSGKPIRVRVAVMLGGILFNLILGWLIMSSVFMVGAKEGGIFIAEVSPNSPAVIAGIKPNDKIIGYSNIDDFQKFVSNNLDQKIELNIQRGNQKINLEVTPRKVHPADEGALGVALVKSEAIPKQNFFQALANGFKFTINIFCQIFLFLFYLIKSAFSGVSVLPLLSGPVGAVKIGADFAYLGITYVLRILALISINLAAFNLIPFPALDGGRLWFFLIEKIRKSPLTQKTQNIVDSLGFSLLIILSIIIMVKDIKGLF